MTLLALFILGLGVVLFDHYGPAAASPGGLTTWENPIGYVAAQPAPRSTAADIVGGPPAVVPSSSGLPPTGPASIGPSPTGPASIGPASIGPASTGPSSAAPSAASSSAPLAAALTGGTSEPTNAVTSLDVPFPRSGPGTFRFATTGGPVLGRSGPIRRFHIAMESNITEVDFDAFVAKVNATLGDHRSWVGGGAYRLAQVPRSRPAEFTVYLVTEATSSRMCAPLQTNGYTSCRQGAHVVLNLDRWMTSVPDYIRAKIPLNTYRTYMINHEVGHALGHDHELCPGPGRPAPVMQQQTLGLHGCTANPWPYVGGKLYAGPPGQY